MFIFSFRLTKQKLIAAGIGIVCIAAVITALVAENSAVTMKTVHKGATNEERMSYIKSFGWDVEGEPLEVLEIIVPQDFDATYESYNKLQKEQGFDLEKYMGKTVKRYTYKVTNYPVDDETEEVNINLLIYENNIIAADICSAELGGFMQAIKQK